MDQNNNPNHADEALKKCPYCAELIKVEAIKCRFCGSSLIAPHAAGNPLREEWYRVREDKIIAGVCAGLAHQFNLSTALLRLAFVVGALLGGGVGLIIYIVLWIILPQRSINQLPPPPQQNPPPQDPTL
jgi:phage shock protein PspC (stress-responsive transcriptional regulator)